MVRSDSLFRNVTIELRRDRTLLIWLFLFLCSVCHPPRSDNIPPTSTSRMKSSRETRMSGKISDGVKQSVFVMRYSTAVWLCVHVCRCHGFRCLCACDVCLCLRGVCLCLCGMLPLKWGANHGKENGRIWDEKLEKRRRKAKTNMEGILCELCKKVHTWQRSSQPGCRNGRIIYKMMLEARA